MRHEASKVEAVPYKNDIDPLKNTSGAIYWTLFLYNSPTRSVNLLYPRQFISNPVFGDIS